MITMAEEILNAMQATTNEAQVQTLAGELVRHLIDEMHRPRSRAIEARLANWLCNVYDADHLISYDTSSEAGLDRQSDLSEYDRKIHNVYLEAAPEVEATKLVQLDELDVNGSGGEGCILRFRLGTKWYRATVQVTAEG